MKNFKRILSVILTAMIALPNFPITQTRADDSADKDDVKVEATSLEKTRTYETIRFKGVSLNEAAHITAVEGPDGKHDGDSFDLTVKENGPISVTVYYTLDQKSAKTDESSEEATTASTEEATTESTEESDKGSTENTETADTESTKEEAEDTDSKEKDKSDLVDENKNDSASKSDTEKKSTNASDSSTAGVTEKSENADTESSKENSASDTSEDSSKEKSDAQDSASSNATTEQTETTATEGNSSNQVKEEETKNQSAENTVIENASESSVQGTEESEPENESAPAEDTGSAIATDTVSWIQGVKSLFVMDAYAAENEQDSTAQEEKNTSEEKNADSKDADSALKEDHQDETAGNTAAKTEEKKDDTADSAEESKELSVTFKDVYTVTGLKSYLSAGEFTGEVGDIKVTVAYEDNTFLEGTELKLSKIDDEEELKKAKEAAEVTDDNANVTVTGMDISFVCDGEKVEPEKSVKVSIDTKNDNDDDNENVQVIHKTDDDKYEKLESESKDGITTFESDKFSPMFLVRAAAVAEANFEFKAYWSNGESDTNDLKTSYGGNYSASDTSTWTNIEFDTKSNAVVTSTLQLEMKLGGDEKTTYKAGTVSIEVPQAYFTGLQSDDPTYVYGTVRKNGADTSMKKQQFSWMVPESPATSGSADFNYTKEYKEVNGKQVAYYKCKNYKDLVGGVNLSISADYRFVPCMLKTEQNHIYSCDLPITCDVNGQSKEREVGVKVTTHPKVLESVNLYDANTYGDNVFFSWQDEWGEKPSNADQYFYVTYDLMLKRDITASQVVYYRIMPNQDDTLQGEYVGSTAMCSNTGSIDDDSWLHHNVEIAAATNKNIANTDAIRFNVVADEATKTGYRGTFNSDPADWKGYCFELPAHTNNRWKNFRILYRYPISVIQEKRKEGIDTSKGFPLPSPSFTIKEASEDLGLHETITVSSINTTVVVSNPGSKGLGYFTKDACSKFTIRGAQTILNDGNPVNIDHFYIGSDYSVDASDLKKTDTGYSTPGMHITMQDDRLLLMRNPEKISMWQYSPTASDQSKLYPYQLNNGDFYYANVYFSDEEYDIQYKEALGIWDASYAASTDYDRYPELELWIKDEDSGEYSKYAIVKRNTDGYSVTIVKDGTELSVSAKEPLKLPQKTVGLKLTYTSGFYHTKVEMYYWMELEPTDHVLERTKADESSNLSTILGATAYGKITWGDNGQTIENTSVKNASSDSWGYIGKEITAISSHPELKKSVNTVSRDLQKRYDKCSIAIDMKNIPDYIAEYSTKEYMNPFMLTSGKFYDLLPKGTKVDKDSVCVYINDRNKANELYKDTNYSLSFIDNWEDSGRTMMIVNIFYVPDEEPYNQWNYRSNGFYLDYDMYNSFDNITDNGTNTYNAIAFEDTSKSEKRFDTNINSSNFDSTNLQDKQWYKSIIEQANKNNKNAELGGTQIVLDAVTILQSGFTERISTPYSVTFDEEGTAYPADTYTWRPKLTTWSDVKAKNIVLYDVLDAEESQNFVSVDVSQMASKSTYTENKDDIPDYCNPVIYYLSLDKVQSNNNVKDIPLNQWDTTKPEKVGAVAVDCSKTSAGNDFILTPGTNAYIDVNMKASGVYQNDATYISKGYVTYTDAVTKISVSSDGNAKVTVHKPKLSIVKHAIIDNQQNDGSSSEPVVLQNGRQTFQYKLILRNIEDASLTLPSPQNVKIKDVLPKGLHVVSISMNDGKKDHGINTDNVITTDSETGVETFTFTASSIARGESLTFTLNVVREDTVTENTWYVNQAEINQIGDWDCQGVNEYQSNKTYACTEVKVTLPSTGGDDSMFLRYAALLLIAEVSAFVFCVRKLRKSR